MSSIQRVYNLARWVLPMSATLFVITVRFARANVASAKDQYFLFAVAAAQLAFPVVASLLGGLFSCPGPRLCHSQRWLTGLLSILFFLQIPSWLYIIWEVKRYTLFIVVLIVIQLVVSWWTLFAASISIYGDAL